MCLSISVFSFFSLLIYPNAQKEGNVSMYGMSVALAYPVALIDVVGRVLVCDKQNSKAWLFHRF